MLKRRILICDRSDNRNDVEMLFNDIEAILKSVECSFPFGHLAYQPVESLHGLVHDVGHLINVTLREQMVLLLTVIGASIVEVIVGRVNGAVDAGAANDCISVCY